MSTDGRQYCSVTGWAVLYHCWLTVLLNDTRHLSFLYSVRYKKDKCRPEVRRTPPPVQQRDLSGWGERAKTIVRRMGDLGGELRKSGEIEWTGSAGTRAFEDVKVDHGGGDVGMAE